MAVIITTDSTCDLNNKYLQDNNIGIFPIKVILGDKTFDDGIDIKPQDIFDYASSTGLLPKTAAGSQYEYQEFFEKHTQNQNTVIHISMSSKASAVNKFAQGAAKNFDNKVFVIDSCALSTGLGLLVVKAVELRSSGMPAKEIVNYLEKAKVKINTSFVVDTLEYLHKGGRCSLLSMLSAKLLKIHPFIDMVDGQLIAKKKYIGSMKKSVISYVKDLIDLYPNYDDSICFITHSMCDEEIVQTVKNKVAEHFKFTKVIETVAGSVITSHCGKGTIGVLFFKEKV